MWEARLIDEALHFLEAIPDARNHEDQLIGLRDRLTEQFLSQVASTSVKNSFTRLHKAIRIHFSPASGRLTPANSYYHPTQKTREHIAILMVDTPIEIKDQNKEFYQEALEFALHHVAYLDQPFEIVLRGRTLLEGALDANSRGEFCNYLDLAAAIALLAGLRPVEVLRDAILESKTPYTVVMASGQAKTRGDQRVYEMPTLIEASLILEGLRVLRTIFDATDLNDNELQKFKNNLLDHVVANFSDLVPTLKRLKRGEVVEKRVNPQRLRAVYDAIAVFFYCPPSVKDFVFVKAINGHKPQKGRSDAAMHYLSYHIADQVIAAYGGQRQGVRLTEPGVSVLSVFNTNSPSATTTSLPPPLPIPDTTLDTSPTINTGESLNMNNTTDTEEIGEIPDVERTPDTEEGLSPRPAAQSYTTPVTASQMTELFDGFDGEDTDELDGENISLASSQPPVSVASPGSVSTIAENFTQPSSVVTLNRDRYMAHCQKMLLSRSPWTVLAALVMLTGKTPAQLLKTGIFKSGSDSWLIFTSQELGSQPQSLPTLVNAETILNARKKLLKHPVIREHQLAYQSPSTINSIARPKVEKALHSHLTDLIPNRSQPITLEVAIAFYHQLTGHTSTPTSQTIHQSEVPSSTTPQSEIPSSATPLENLIDFAWFESYLPRLDALGVKLGTHNYQETFATIVDLAETTVASHNLGDSTTVAPPPSLSHEVASLSKAIGFLTEQLTDQKRIEQENLRLKAQINLLSQQLDQLTAQLSQLTTEKQILQQAQQQLDAIARILQPLPPPSSDIPTTTPTPAEVPSPEIRPTSFADLPASEPPRVKPSKSQSQHTPSPRGALGVQKARRAIQAIMDYNATVPHENQWFINLNLVDVLTHYGCGRAIAQRVLLEMNVDQYNLDHHLTKSHNLKHGKQGLKISDFVHL